MRKVTIMNKAAMLGEVRGRMVKEAFGGALAMKGGMKSLRNVGRNAVDLGRGLFTPGGYDARGNYSTPLFSGPSIAQKLPRGGSAPQLAESARTYHWRFPPAVAAGIQHHAEASGADIEALRNLFNANPQARGEAQRWGYNLGRAIRPWGL